jgi:hypothetical protein
MGQFYNIKMCYPSNYPNFSVIKWQVQKCEF